MAQIFAFLSGKGGAGKSTSAVMIARELQSSGAKVLLVDCDAGLRSLEIFSGVSQDVFYHWGDVLSGGCKTIDAIRRCPAGMDLMAAPNALGEEATPEHFTEMIHGLENSYDYILIDGPAGLGRGFRIAASAADKLLMISAPDDVSLYACAAARKAAKALGKKQTRLIINHFRYKAVKNSLQKNIDDSIDKSGVRLIGIVPEDKNLWYFGSQGMLPKSRSIGIEAFARIAGRLRGESVPLNLRDLQ